jgi:hypothetical protein
MRLLTNNNKNLAHFFIVKEISENAVFLTRKRGFFVTEVAVGRKYRKNE